jgi:hypothetical protein
MGFLRFVTLRQCSAMRCKSGINLSDVSDVSAACKPSVGSPIAATVEPANDSMRVQAQGGVTSVRCEERGSATALRQTVASPST